MKIVLIFTMSFTCMLIGGLQKKRKPTKTNTKRRVARVNLKDMNNKVLDGVGPLKPPTFGNYSHIPAAQTQRAAILPVIKAIHLSHGPEQTARMTQTGLESLQRSSSPCRWGEECPAGHLSHGDGFDRPQGGVATLPQQFSWRWEFLPAPPSPLDHLR